MGEISENPIIGYLQGAFQRGLRPTAISEPTAQPGGRYLCVLRTPTGATEAFTFQTTNRERAQSIWVEAQTWLNLRQDQEGK